MKETANKKKPKAETGVKMKPVKGKSEPEEVEDEFDFGGLPKGVSFKRNMGCGG